MVPRVLGAPGLWPPHSCSGTRALGGRLAEAADSRSSPLRHCNWGASWKGPLLHPSPTPSPARLSEPPAQAAFAGWGASTGQRLTRSSVLPLLTPRNL